MDRQEKKTARDKRVQDIANRQKELSAEYWKIREMPAFLDLQKFVADMSAYHVRIAKDGMGYQDQKQPDGTTKQVLTTFDNNQKLDHLQRAAGLEEVLDYIARKLTIKAQVSKKDKSDE